MRLLDELGRALLDAGSMTWQITWSLILGFTLSAVIQAVVRREAIARHLGSHNTKTLALATGLGAASSSCSYAAVALARALECAPTEPTPQVTALQTSESANRGPSRAGCRTCSLSLRPSQVPVLGTCGPAGRDFGS
jgi:uncharacterized membrane protein YraQ (UPF0718 family)